MVEPEDFTEVLEVVMQRLAIAMDLPPYVSLDQSRDSLQELICDNMELKDHALELINEFTEEVMMARG